MNPLLTVSDVSVVLEAVGVTLTPRQIRYAGLPCTRRGWGKTGGRLFSTVDAGVLGVYGYLLRQCRALGLPLWTARAAVRYREDEIRRAIASGRPSWLVLDTIRATVALDDSRPSGGSALELAGWGRRIERAVSEFRETYPEVWTGTSYVAAEELIEMTA